MAANFPTCIKQNNDLMATYNPLKPIPDNLLLDSNLNIKIADFVLSNIIINGIPRKASCGLPNYTGPEVMSSKLYSGHEVDVGSGGMISSCCFARKCRWTTSISLIE